MSTIDLQDTELAEEVNEYYTHLTGKGLEGDGLADALRVEAEEARRWGREELAAALEGLVTIGEEGAVTRRLVTSKGDVVETTLTDDEAMEIVRGMGGWNSFAASLYAQYLERNSLSPRQWPWVHKLATEQVAREKNREEDPSSRFENVPPLFRRALDSGLRYPRITLDMDEGRVMLKVAGPRSKTPGAIHVTDGRSYGENTYYGRIDKDGTWHPGRRTPGWVSETLAALNDQTLSFVVRYGRQTGSCCFCNRELTTRESVAAGYGPVCAGHYGLPWGDHAE